MSDQPDATRSITLYGASWCPDCRRSKRFLGEQRVPYIYVDIENDPEEQEKAIKYNDVVANAVIFQNVGDQTTILRELMNELPTADREILTLRYALDYNAGEIADILHINATAVHMRLSRARQRLAQRLTAEGVEQTP